jgi:ubiquitin-activating enzyme E1
MEGNNILENIKNITEKKELKYDVVVISEFIQQDEIIKINETCRNNNIGFIYTSELGLFGFCFVDFGNNFMVIDENGEEPLKYCIKSISKGKKGIVTIDTTAGTLKLGNNDKVTFNEIEGMKELNNCEPISIKILSNNSLEIIDTSNFSDYTSGGIMREVKYKKEYNFTSLKKRFEIPYTEEEGLPEQTDLTKINTNEIIHIGLLALNKFYKEKNFLPELNNEKQAKILISYGKEIYDNKKKEDLYWLNGLEEEFEDFYQILEKTLFRLSLWARAQISPISSFLGGISAQEIVKWTGKYNPIHQWIWFNFTETVENLEPNIDRNLMNDRYNDQIAIYGNKIQEKLFNSNMFIIGAGALSCEFLKTFSLMGISTKEDRKVTITDNDNIEISNLNRQFLFRHDNIGEPKSIIASNEAKKMNSDFNVYPMKARIGIENEYIFNEEFWEKQDYIINAVDNLAARLYIQEQCLIFRKILIDSGTLGTIANSQVVVPFKTIKYFSKKEEDNEQRAIAMCTLRNFPTLINHCIEWARDNFDGYFVNVLQHLKRFCQNKEEYFQQLEKLDNFDEQIKIIKNIIKYSKFIIDKIYDDCLEIAYNEYNRKFNNEIIQIITVNPPDSINEDGSKFWSSNKRIPIPLPFTKENKLILLFIKKYAEILACSVSIPIINDDEYIKKKCLSFKTEKFIPIARKNIKNNYNKRYRLPKENESKEEKQLRKKKKIEEIEARLKIKKETYEKIKSEANNINIPDYNDISEDFKIKEFEKDDDSNGHIQFYTHLLI